MNDALLVTFLDGEATPEERAVVERAIAADERVREKLELLRRTRGALQDYLAGPALPAAPAPARSNVLSWLAAAAALIVVVSIALSRHTGGAVAAASNDWLDLRVAPAQAGQALFSNIRFSLIGRSKTATPCRIVAREPGETDAQLAERLLAEPADRAFVPLVADGEVVLPDGSVRRGAFRRVHGTFATAADPTAIRLDLVDLVVPHPSINPWLAVELTDTGATENFLTGFQQGGSPEIGGAHGFVPEEPGVHRLRVSLRSLPPALDSRFPTFAEPLTVETVFDVLGVVGEWSEPQDGLSARIVAAAGPGRAKTRPFALQLRNDSDRPRAYNVGGITRAPIPQPFHFDLLVDGERWQQRDRLPVVFTGGSEFLPQPARSMRSVVALDDFWHRDGKSLAELRGKHTIALRFHFQPTLWGGDPRDLWQGEVETPPITIEVDAR